MFNGNSNDTQLYDTLGVNKSSSDSEIKKAYRKLALKHHPDRNLNNKEEAEAKFKEISFAYEILSNPEKKEKYDRFGLDSVKNSGESNINPFDIFSNLFGGGGMGGMDDLFSGQRAPQKTRAKDRVEQMNATLEEIYNCKVKRFNIQKKIICLKCNGTGGKNPDSVIICNKCEGKGQIIEIKTMGPGFISQSTRICYVCNGKGKIIKENEKCLECDGTKYTQITKRINVTLSKNIRNGSKIIVEGEADEVIDSYNKGDLIFVVNEKKHNVFQRENNDLILLKNILLSEALTKTSFFIEHLDKRKLLIEIDTIITPTTKKKILYEGLNKDGDLIIHFNIIFPNILDKDRKKYLNKLLPVPQSTIDLSNKYEIPTIEDYFNESDFNDTFETLDEVNLDNEAEDNRERYEPEQVGCPTQ